MPAAPADIPMTEKVQDDVNQKVKRPIARKA
jgi:hypothetical protein